MVFRIYRCKTILIFAMHLFVLPIYPACVASLSNGAETTNALMNEMKWFVMNITI
jgi:uncharacterized membrane protein